MFSLLILLVGSSFTGPDTICTNDWWNRDPNPIHDVKAERDKVVAFALVNPDEKHQYCNKEDSLFNMICEVPKEFE